MKNLSPAQSLVFLLLAGLAIAGWLYGIHWKRTASGDLFTKDEMHIIRLQDQIRVLTEDNAKLNGKLVDLMSEAEEDADPAEEKAEPSPES